MHSAPDLARATPRPTRLRHLRHLHRLLAAAAAFVLAALAAAPLHAQPAEPSRGRLLYETHCVACHDSQMHWRDRRVARDWPGLVAQVRAWQERARLGWSDNDVVEVARHLNDTIYRHKRPLALGHGQRPLALGHGQRPLALGHGPRQLALGDATRPLALGEDPRPLARAGDQRPPLRATDELPPVPSSTRPRPNA